MDKIHLESLVLHAHYHNLFYFTRKKSFDEIIVTVEIIEYIVLAVILWWSFFDKIWYSQWITWLDQLGDRWPEINLTPYAQATWFCIVDLTFQQTTEPPVIFLPFYHRPFFLQIHAEIIAFQQIADWFCSIIYKCFQIN